ncbi:MAG: A/G-specific adenine glycosylase [Gammaproteobacteria bacterium]|nr:A/G-specific adenine glycosylase [Gammaproteobacteria bacterium]
MSHTKSSFAPQLLAWFDQHGRHNLPWQNDRNAYRVWLSEIMLQQTQVATVIPYFERFTARFPALADLSAAHVDDVLALWTGLGYYTRARNLHKCAQVVTAEHQGVLPNDAELLALLPGIGRSTAAAIVSQAYNQPAAILDGNVKRVLARLYGIEGWPGQKAIENQLWQLAEALTPKQRNADYSQAIMDLGATICRRSNPLCVACPMQTQCQALAQNKVADLPTRKPKKSIPEKQTWALLVANQHLQIQMQQRPHKGIWGGLWSLPEFNDHKALQQHLALQGINQTATPLPQIKHAFSHYKLTIHPYLVVLPHNHQHIQETDHSKWYAAKQIDTIGLPSPIKSILLRYWT